MAKEPLNKENGKFRSPGRSIPGWGNSDLYIEVPEGLVAYKKELRTDDLPATTSDNQTITWFNNFGVMDGNGDDLTKDKNIRYKVTVQRPPAGPKKEKRGICIYDDSLRETDSKRKVVKVAEDASSTNDEIVFYLNLGDPPTGLFP